MRIRQHEYSTKVMDQYEFDDEPLGSGNFGTVYRVTNNLGRPYACKVFRPETLRDHDSFMSFITESKIGTVCNHDNLVAVHQRNFLKHRESGEKVPFILMDFVDGMDLASFNRMYQQVKKEPLPWKFVALLLSYVAAGLNVLHHARILHGDIKEHNILLPRNSLPKLTDYGISCLFDRTIPGPGEARGAELGSGTHGLIRGTVCYIAPEQITKEEPLVGERQYKSDVYALGVVALKASVGLPDFLIDQTPEMILVNTVMRNGDLLDYVGDARLPDAFKSIVRSCLAMNVDLRPSSEELQASLLQGIYGEKKDITMLDIYDALQRLVRHGQDQEKLNRAFHALEDLNRIISEH